MRKSSFGAAILAGLLLASSAAQAVPSAKAAPNRGRAIDLLAEGQAKEAAGDRAGAIALYQQSIQLAPSPAGYYHLGHAYAESGDKATARQYLAQALELNPNFELAKAELAAIDTGKSSKKRGGAAAGTSSAGGTGNGVGVVPVGYEAPAAAALTERAANAPVNVEKVQREYTTIRSLRRPDSLGETVAAPPTSAAPGIVSFVPPAPSTAGAGSPPVVLPPEAVPTPGGAAQAALFPPVPSMVVNDSVPDIIVHNADAAPGVAVAAATEIQADAPRGVRATPEPGPDPGTAAPVINLREGGSLHPAGTELEGVGVVPLEPPVPPSQIGAVERPARAAAGTDGGAAPSLASAAGGKPSVADINAAAFGAAADAQKPSTVYNNPTRVAVGTFAFHKDQGDRYRDAGRFADAAFEYQTALRLCPTDTETRTLHAEMLSRSGQTAQAEQQFERAQAQAPDDPRVHYKQGNAYRDEQKYDLAIGSYLKALSLDPNDKFTINNLGVVYMEKGDYPKAAARFKRVLDLDPNYANALLNLGILYDDHLGDDQQALTYYDRYMALPGVPRKGEVQRWAEAIRREQGQPTP